jgi:ABC-type polysaccharide/polyol phosphate export permease
MNLWRDLAASLRNPEFWALSSWLDIVVKSRQSRLGVLWLLMPSVVYVWGVGGFFAALQGHSFSGFVGYVAPGYVVFRLISSVITESCSALHASTPFILDGRTRLTDFVLRVLAKALFYFLVSMPVVVVSLAISPDWHWQGLPASLAAFAWVLANTVWIGVVFALIGARFPDMAQFVTNIFMFAFLLTPIIWHASTMPAHSLRGTLMRANPLFHMIEAIRAPLLGSPVPSVSYFYLAAMTLVGGIAASLAYRRFARYVPVWV